VTLNGLPSVQVVAPLSYQSRDVGRIVTELDVSDLIAERRQATLWLLFGNTAATALLTFGGWLAVARSLRPVALLTGAMDETRGAPRPISPDAIPRGDLGLARLIGTYNHMTEADEARAEAERRLAARERFVSLGRLSSSLAHEINNPLGGLLNAADTIRTHADRPEVVRQSADLMVRGLQHMRDVARAILDQSRLDRDGQPLRVEDFEDLRLLIGPETGHRGQILDWQIDGHAQAFAALPSALVRQIVPKLLLNASAASAEGGRVGLSVAAAADTLQLAVRDDGSGLSPADLERLFPSGPLPPGGRGRSAADP
jgi:signal transduction histidine kinase